MIAAIATGGLLCSPTWSPGRRSRRRQGGSAPAARFSRVARVRGDWRVAVGAGPARHSLRCSRSGELGIWWSDAIAWPLALAAFGVALLWVRSPRRAALPADGQAPHVEPPRPSPEARPRRAGSKLAEEYSGAFGVLLVVGAALLFLSSNHVLGGVRDAALTAVVVDRRARLDPGPVPLAVRQEPRGRAGRRIRSAGARRGGGPPARLGPPDARLGAEAGRRPGGGRDARPQAGAGAPRLARRRGPARPGERSSRPRSAQLPKPSRSTTASRSSR